MNSRVVLDPGHWADPDRDVIQVDGSQLGEERKIYLMLHKPRGYLTTRRDPEGRSTIYDLLPPRYAQLDSVGRLDLDSSGLLLLTNDSDFGHQMTSPEHHVPKTYHVKASNNLTDDQLAELGRGVILSDGATRPAQVRRLRNPGGKTIFEIVITEGRNRQIRRMVQAIGSKVVSLTRVAIGALTLGTLKSGEYRELKSEAADAALSGRRSKRRG